MGDDDGVGTGVDVRHAGVDVKPAEVSAGVLVVAGVAVDVDGSVETVGWATFETAGVQPASRQVRLTRSIGKNNDLCMI